ncbi:MAG: M14-type cytosolic carboxypeptidase [Pirellulales bacterium]
MRSDFENGSAQVIGIQQDAGLIQIRPAGDPKRGWPCWWSFQVDGVESGRTLTIEIDRAPGNLSAAWAQPGYAAYSIDGGKTWLQTAQGVVKDGRKSYAAKIDAKSGMVCLGAGVRRR